MQSTLKLSKNIHTMLGWVSFISVKRAARNTTERALHKLNLLYNMLSTTRVQNMLTTLYLCSDYQ